ncbi:hypothetical protein STEG23_026953, partial [Scotinomys teguina]
GCSDLAMCWLVMTSFYPCSRAQPMEWGCTLSSWGWHTDFCLNLEMAVCDVGDTRVYQGQKCEPLEAEFCSLGISSIAQ